MSARGVNSNLEQINTVTISWKDFKKALKRNYLDEQKALDSRNYVLRLYPPFENEMEAEYHESEKGTYYPRDMNPKPIHVQPQVIIHNETGFFTGASPSWPTEANTRRGLSQAEIQDIGGIEEAVEESREWFWAEMKSKLPSEFDIGRYHGLESYTVNLEWSFGE